MLTSNQFSPDLSAPQPKMMVTASFGVEPGRKVEYIPLVEKALELSSHKPSKVLIYSRPDMVSSRRLRSGSFGVVPWV